MRAALLMMLLCQATPASAWRPLDEASYLEEGEKAWRDGLVEADEPGYFRAAIDGQGRPVLAILSEHDLPDRETIGGRLAVHRWEEDRWRRLPDVAEFESKPDGPRLYSVPFAVAADPEDRVLIAWQPPSGTQIHLLQEDGATWHRVAEVTPPVEVAELGLHAEGGELRLLASASVDQGEELLTATQQRSGEWSWEVLGTGSMIVPLMSVRGRTAWTVLDAYESRVTASWPQVRLPRRGLRYLSASRRGWRWRRLRRWWPIGPLRRIVPNNGFVLPTAGGTAKTLRVLGGARFVGTHYGGEINRLLIRRRGLRRALASRGSSALYVPHTRKPRQLVLGTDPRGLLWLH